MIFIIKCSTPSITPFIFTIQFECYTASYFSFFVESTPPFHSKGSLEVCFFKLDLLFMRWDTFEGRESAERLLNSSSSPADLRLVDFLFLSTFAASPSPVYQSPSRISLASSSSQGKGFRPYQWSRQRGQWNLGIPTSPAFQSGRCPYSAYRLLGVKVTLLLMLDKL